MNFDRYQQLVIGARVHFKNDARKALTAAIENEETGLLQGFPIDEMEEHEAFLSELKTALAIAETGNAVMNREHHTNRQLFNLAIRAENVAALQDYEETVHDASIYGQV